LKLSPKTVKALCARGDIPGARKVGRRWRIPSWGVEAMFGGDDGNLRRSNTRNAPSGGVVSGKDYERIVKGTKAEAKAFEARFRASLEVSEPVEARVVLIFADFCVSRYRPHAEMHLRQSTWKVRTYQIETLTTAPLGPPGRTYTLGGKRLTEFSTELVEESSASDRDRSPPWR
jgi:hypothetical protein